MTSETEKELLQTVLNTKGITIDEYPLYYAVGDLLIRENEDGTKYIVKFDNNKKETIIGKYDGNK